MIRLWKLGNLEHRVAPTRQAADKLKEILDGVDNDKINDIIWGPDIEVVQIGVGGEENGTVTNLIVDEAAYDKLVGQANES